MIIKPEELLDFDDSKAREAYVEKDWHLVETDGGFQPTTFFSYRHCLSDPKANSPVSVPEYKHWVSIVSKNSGIQIDVFYPAAPMRYRDITVLLFASASDGGDLYPYLELDISWRHLVPGLYQQEILPALILSSLFPERVFSHEIFLSFRDTIYRRSHRLQNIFYATFP